MNISTFSFLPLCRNTALAFKKSPLINYFLSTRNIINPPTWLKYMTFDLVILSNTLIMTPGVFFFNLVPTYTRGSSKLVPTSTHPAFMFVCDSNRNIFPILSNHSRIDGVRGIYENNSKKTFMKRGIWGITCSGVGLLAKHLYVHKPTTNNS